MKISSFIDNHFKHFNAAALKDAAQGYKDHLDNGGKMFVTLAGAMSTAELGKSLAEMIRQDKVHAISCTGANLEEDVYKLVAHSHYKRIPNYRDLTPEQEKELLDQHLNRVTDTCIPEAEAFRKLERYLLDKWNTATQNKERFFPHQFLQRLFDNTQFYLELEAPLEESWLYAAWQKRIPIFVPGWEDSTSGNIFTGYCIREELSPSIVKGGIEYMMELAQWYTDTSKNHSIGFFQIGGGIAGDFPICVVPMLHQDIQRETPYWGYFCQISDSTTSYGSYSGAVPNEKITWGKLDVNTPKFIIESDATIAAPLMFAYILEW